MLLLAVALACAPILIVALYIAHLWIHEHTDDQMFGYYGWRIAHGAVPYVDVWDNKPPGIYWTNALGYLLGGDTYYGVIALCTLAMVVTGLAFFAATARLYNRGSAALGTVLLCFFVSHGAMEGATNRTETFLVMFETLAVLTYVAAFRRPHWWSWLLVGMLCGAAFLYKQVGLAAWGAMGLHLIFCVIMRHLSWRTGLARCCGLLGGVIIAGALAAGGLYASGGVPAIREALYATFGFNAAYFAVGDSAVRPGLAARLLTWNNVFPLLTLPILMAIAAAIHAFLRYTWPWWSRAAREAPDDAPPAAVRDESPVPAHMLLFAIWALVAFYGVLLSPQRYRWYLVPTVPPLLFMSTYLIYRIRAELGLLKRMSQYAWVTAAVVVLVYFGRGAVKQQWQQFWTVWQFRYDYRGSGSWEDQRPWHVIAEAVERHAEPGDRLQCWGWLPAVYFETRLPNACRFTTTEKVGQVGRHATMVLEEIAAALEDGRATILAIRAEDYEWAHGRVREGVEPPPVLHGPLIDTYFEQVEEVAAANTYIFRRKPPTTLPAP